MGNSASLKDVAQVARVSISTASRALAGNPAISTKTRQRVVQAAQDLKYQPNAQARGLRSSRTNIIGLTIPSLKNPYFAAMAATIQDLCADNGQTTLITTSNEDPAEMEKSLQSLSQMRVDGMIVVPGERSKNVLADIADSGTPIVLIDRTCPGIELPSVVSDPLPGILSAMRELTARGHTNIGYLSGPVSTSTGAERLRAFETTCTEFQVSASRVYRGGFEVSEGISGAKQLLSQNVTALIAGDSMMTFGALDHCYKSEVRVGVDLAFVGFDDLLYMTLQPTPISVIDQDVCHMAELAHFQLSELLSDRSPTSTARIETTYISRPSTSCMPSHNHKEVSSFK